jgi:hypothetical protein
MKEELIHKSNSKDGILSIRDTQKIVPHGKAAIFLNRKL